MLNKAQPVYSMSDRDDGGPAFPVGAENGLGHVTDGMSLRDYFAIHADLDGYSFNNLEAMCSFAGESTPKTDAELLMLGVRVAAKIRYIYADAMLAARSK